MSFSKASLLKILKCPNGAQTSLDDTTAQNIETQMQEPQSNSCLYNDSKNQSNSMPSVMLVTRKITYK